ncbi:MAG: hypothetical protein FWE49_06310, partial [Synergistaceae bacterium]|nr:hypothetical protein [Synergistaceae bacterium]
MIHSKITNVAIRTMKLEYKLSLRRFITILLRRVYIMKGTLKKFFYLALILALATASAPRVSAATINTATIDIPSSQWEMIFLAVLETLEIDKPDKPVFTVKEYPTQSGLPGFEHRLDINKCLSVAYYDDGKDKFNSAVLTIKLDEVGGDTDPVWYAVIATTLAGQRTVKTE